ncbi:hypothetical protein IQ07DRAFT_504155 [Pyrenochaeta sp. DS3sAY3a]|nr:hypothetical protein IQ07DRAFT_504155 [Pyrenochaeta sp. DS3sAY3a]
MTAEAFDAVLAEPDSSAAQSRLHGLVTARNYNGITLPAVAGRYLHAFCDVTSSSLRRRWVGIALAGMLAASRKVPQHLAGLHGDLHAVGDVILSSTQSEEIKIIAGIVLRQCRERGITYNHFWSSDKVRKSIPNFPERSGPRWMSDFQKFLDQLGHLALVSTSTDPSIIYPISIVASDGFRWRDPNDSLPIALIQEGMLTVIAPDEALQDVQFVDIPISRIQSVLCQPSTLHNSQALVSEHEPWDIVLSLQARPWSYRLNTLRRAGTDITILFAHALDAREWEASIKECQVLYEKSREPDISKGHSNMQREDRIQPSSTSKDLTSLRQFDIPDHSVSPDSASVRGRITAPEHEVSLHSPSKEPARGNGKLPKISQATKLKAYKQLPEKQAPSSVTKQQAASTKVVKRAVAATAVKPVSKLQKQWPRSSQPRDSSAGSTRSQVKRKAGDDDEEYVPDDARSGRRTKKRQKNATKTTAAKRPIAAPRGRELITGSGTVSSRHSLITGLLSEQLPPKPTTLSNMRPGEHPARVAKDVSKSPSQVDQPIPHFKRPQTPGDMQIRSNFVLPTTHVMRGSKDDSNREQQATFIEILSSNSKPVPASPNADSSAISGHADCNEIVIEKEKGDWQTAQSDPFNRRSSNPNSTAFMRRLTGEDPTNNIHVSEDLNTADVQALGTNAARAIDPVRTYIKKQATQSVRTAAKGAVEGKDARNGPPERIADIAQTVPTIHGHEDLHTEGETTLAGDAKFEQPFLEPKASPIHFRSSPPVIGSLGSRSSTSAEVEAPSPSPLPTSEAELMNWEASLKSHQRSLYDSIIRVSKRAIQRIVDSETAVTDIVEVFEKDAEHVLRSLLQEQHREYNHVFGSMENKTKQLKRELEVTAGRLKEDRRRFKVVV